MKDGNLIVLQFFQEVGNLGTKKELFDTPFLSAKIFSCRISICSSVHSVVLTIYNLRVDFPPI